MAEIVQSSRGKPMLVHNGFCYHFHTMNKQKTRRYWRCEDREFCLARCITGEDLTNIVVFEDGTGGHSHTAGVSADVRRARNAVKRRAEDHVHEAPSAVLRHALAGVNDEEVIMQLPSKNTMKRQVRHYRYMSRCLHGFSILSVSLSQVKRTQGARRPAVPRSLEDIEITGDYLLTLGGERFLLKDTGADDPDRMLIFATRQNLQYLSQSPTLYCDGTFKTAPGQFLQLFTIHGRFRDHVFPFVYALTKRKTTDTYTRLYDAVKQGTQDRNIVLAPATVMMDFEYADIMAARAIFPGAQIRCCLFHWSQALIRQVASMGFQAQYQTPGHRVRKQVGMLLGLPFVPLAEVEDVLDYVGERCDDDLQELVDYVDRVYVTGVRARGRRRAVAARFPPETWNVYNACVNGEQRTNNAVEGWHNRFQKAVAVHHPSIWRFLDMVRDEQRDNERDITRLLGGQRDIRAPLPRRYITNQEQLLNIVARYDEYKLNDELDVYLRAVSYKLKVNPSAVVEENEDE